MSYPGFWILGTQANEALTAEARDSASVPGI